MDVIVSRLRLAGPAPVYQYRGLVPLYEVGSARRPRCVVLQAALGNGRVPSTRLADVIAPDSWFERHLAIPCGLAAHLTFVARRNETLMAADLGLHQGCERRAA